MRAHKYADAWPMLSEDELADLAEDIKANGLRNAVVLYDGQILDGRNRHAACALADVEPTFVQFDGDDDEALAFVQSVNGARRHQSKGSLAASWALSMLAAGKRENGRWTYGESKDLDNLNRTWTSQLGLIADYAPDLLVAVRDDLGTLNGAHDHARAVRDEVLRKQEDERLAAEAEAKAERFINSEAPDLAADVASGKHHSYLEAEAVWKIRNAEEAKARSEAERLARQKKQDHIDGIKRYAKYLASWTAHYGLAAGLRDNPDREEILAAMNDPALRKYRTDFLAFEAANDWRTA